MGRARRPVQAVRRSPCIYGRPAPRCGPLPAGCLPPCMRRPMACSPMRTGRRCPRACAACQRCPEASPCPTLPSSYRHFPCLVPSSPNSPSSPKLPKSSAECENETPSVRSPFFAICSKRSFFPRSSLSTDEYTPRHFCPVSSVPSARSRYTVIPIAPIYVTAVAGRLCLISGAP